MPAITELDRMPPGFFDVGRRVPALVPEGSLDIGLLTSFRDLMAGAGEAVSVHRMRYDRRYALDLIALAHCSRFRVLRRIALALFDRYIDPVTPLAP